MFTEAMSLRYIQCRCATLECIATITGSVDFIGCPIGCDSTASALIVDRFPPKNHRWFQNGLGLITHEH